MPTIAEHLQDFLKFFFSQPEIAERLKPYDAALEKVRAFGFEIVRHVQETPPSPGYEPWLAAHGVHPLFGRPLAGLTVRSGNRVAKDRARLPTVVSAIKFLASPGHHHGSISRRVAVLLAACKETSVVETIFVNAGLQEFEFARLLGLYSEGDKSVYPRLAEIASALVPHLPSRRGPKITAASAAHERFLEIINETWSPHAYTWNDVEEDFTDSVTEATRREFNSPQFDPRPAYRRLKARKKR